MLKIFICFAVMISLSSTVMAQTKPAVKDLPMTDGSGSEVGKIKVTEENKGVKISLNLKGLKPGTYAMHIHGVGKCEGPKFESAGDHFNPSKKMHGKLNPKGPHAGDLPNIVVPANGQVKQDIMLSGMSMKMESTNTLATPEGTSLVIHEKPDDMKTDPSGNSGDRLFCAVLTGQQIAK